MKYISRYITLFSLPVLLLAYQNCANEMKFDSQVASLSELPQVDPAAPVEAPPGTGDKIICDPFHGEISNCDRGFYGSLYTMNYDEAVLPENRHVNAYFEKGSKVNEESSYIVFPQLMFPTQEYTQGFRFEDDYLRDQKGDVLFEYFALNLKAILYLNQLEPGWYQFAIVSDDGSTLESIDPTSGMKQMLVDNDGYHSTRMECSSEAIYIGEDQLVPLNLKYFQGPRTAIALSLLWRRAETGDLDSNYDQIAQETCGISARDFFGDWSIDPQSRIVPVEGSLWEKTYNNGWSTIDSQNLLQFSQW